MIANVSLGASHVQKCCHCERQPCLQSLVDKKNNTGIWGGCETHWGRVMPDCVCVCVCVCVCREESLSHKTKGIKIELQGFKEKSSI